jgi:hypothetical protein
MQWSQWRRYFEDNATRALPDPGDPASALPPAWRAPLVRSLARFQIGETGEGRIARDIHHVHIDGIDDDYRVALGLFVREEGRHARILADIVRAMGGRLLDKSWTERAFRRVRRLAGVREKLVVLLIAEVIGVAFYGAIAARLPPGTMRSALEAICDDEEAHLAFHCDFFRTQVHDRTTRIAFRALCAAGGVVAGAIVLVDHAETLRALGIAPRDIASSMRALVVRTVRRVEEDPRGHVQSEGNDQSFDVQTRSVPPGGVTVSRSATTQRYALKKSTRIVCDPAARSAGAALRTGT